MQNTGIIRTRFKVEATIHNDQCILQLLKEFASFSEWLNWHHPKTKAEWMKLFKEIFHCTVVEKL
jgi:DNA-3-methyladenine glycosylase I